MSQRQTDISAEEHLGQGHLGCAGCGERLALRLALKALGRETILIVPASCSGVLDGPFPYSAVDVPLLHSAFETAAPMASGLRAALDIRGEARTTVVAWAGDGASFDIGFQALSAAAERNEDFIYVCYDNEAYMNTGTQRSSATPWGARTTTTPPEAPKAQAKKDLMEILAAHGIPYATTATIAYPQDLTQKFQRARGMRGLRFIHILCPCPTGWSFSPSETVRVSRLAVQTGVFPLYEVEAGERYRLNLPIQRLPVADYLERQGRFDHLSAEDKQFIQSAVDRRWQRLLRKASA